MSSSPSTESLDVELACILRPVGLFLLVAEVPARNPLLNRRDDVRLWMRWAEPEETGLEGPRIEIAESTPRDEEIRTARVVARATPTNPESDQSIFQIFELQGLIDLFAGTPAEPNGPWEGYAHWLVCVDLTRGSAQYGLSVDHFPKHYV